MGRSIACDLDNVTAIREILIVATPPVHARVENNLDIKNPHSVVDPHPNPNETLAALKIQNYTPPNCRTS